MKNDPRNLRLIISSSLVILSALIHNPVVAQSSQQELENKVKTTLAKMTTHEKIQLLHATGKFTSLGVPRLGIKELHHSDGPHGVRAEVDWNNWNVANWNNDSIVAFPSLTCLAATWNRELSAKYGHAVGEEFAFRDKHVMLGPGVTINRMPLNGRSFEYMGEDPYLAGEMVVPYIQKVQELGVACCLKHFFLNNQETDRMRVNVNVSERAVNEIYLPAFKKAVQKADVWTIMGSYNKWKNVYCCQNDTLLNKILKDEWGFDGAVISDWGGVHDTWQAATGGMDIEMGTFTNGKTSDRSSGWDTYYLADPFEQLINEGKIPMSVLDDKASRVLRTIFRTAMNPNRVYGAQCSEEHYDICREIGEEGIVLMKNDRDLLPLNAAKYNRILVVGENATRSLTQGGGSSELKTKYDISPLEALQSVFKDKIDYAQGYYSGNAMYARQTKLDENEQKRLQEEALIKAKNADLIVFIGGLNKNGNQDCEDTDRKEYQLSFGQPELIKKLAKIQKNMIVVTFGGNPFDTSCMKDIPAFLHCWYLGSMSGTALTNVMTGKTNPSGKLPVTFAHNLNDYPCFHYGKKGYPGVDFQVYYDEGIYVGYRYFNTNNVKPAYSFGHGLSYTSFKYGKPVLSKNIISKDENVQVSIPITNIGKRQGKEVVQLYVGMKDSKIDRPAKELKDFAKISLMPGETKNVTFTINPEYFRYYDEISHKWDIESGKYTLFFNDSEISNKSTIDVSIE